MITKALKYFFSSTYKISKYNLKQNPDEIQTFLKIPTIYGFGELHIEELNDLYQETPVDKTQHLLTVSYRNCAFLKKVRRVGPVLPCMINKINISPGNSYLPNYRAFEILVKDVDLQLYPQLREDALNGKGIEMQFLYKQKSGDEYDSEYVYYDDWIDGGGGDGGGGDGGGD